MTLTRAEYCRQIAHFVQNAAHWASDALSLPDRAGEPMPLEYAQRFIDEAREHLDWIEEMARGTARSDAQEGGTDD